MYLKIRPNCCELSIIIFSIKKTFDIVIWILEKKFEFVTYKLPQSILPNRISQRNFLQKTQRGKHLSKIRGILQFSHNLSQVFYYDREEKT
jgi:hypothetical protein